MQQFQSEKILSKRLILYKYTENDVDFVLECTHSFEAAGDWLSLEKLTRSQYLQRYNKDYYWNNHAYSFTIHLRKPIDHRARIGLIRYWADPADHRTALLTVQIAYPDLRGKGYGTEAQKVLIKQIFRSNRFSSVAMHTDLKNIAQQKCLKKLGFSASNNITYSDFGKERNGTLYTLSKESYKVLENYIYHA